MKQLQVRSFHILFHFPFIFFPSMLLNTLTSPPGTCCRPPSPRLLQLSGGGLTNCPTSAAVCVCDSDASLSCLPQGHFSTCAFNVIPCPNRCSVKLTRRDLPDHLQHDCPKRKVKCEFCGSEFTGEAYEVNADSKPVFLFPSYLLQHGGSLT